MPHAARAGAGSIKTRPPKVTEGTRINAGGGFAFPCGDERFHLVVNSGGQRAGICQADGDARCVQQSILRSE